MYKLLQHIKNSMVLHTYLQPDSLKPAAISSVKKWLQQLQQPFGQAKNSRSTATRTNWEQTIVRYDLPR